MRAVTFNLMHGATTEDRRGNPEQVAEACRNLKPDILALQEVDVGVKRSGRAHLAEIAAEATGMQMVFEHTMSFRGGLYGNALLARGDIEVDGVLMLLGGYRFKMKPEPRNAIMATVRIDGQEISVAATHLATQRIANHRQLGYVAASLAGRPEPHILMGDLNQSRRAVLSQPHIKNMELAEGPPTYPATNPSRRIDHIAVRGLSITSVDTVRLPISDHLALIAEVE